MCEEVREVKLCHSACLYAHPLSRCCHNGRVSSYKWLSDFSPYCVGSSLRRKSFHVCAHPSVPSKLPQSFRQFFRVSSAAYSAACRVIFGVTHSGILCFCHFYRVHFAIKLTIIVGKVSATYIIAQHSSSNIPHRGLCNAPHSHKNAELEEVIAFSVITV